jgi:hypothetical protein
MVDPITRAWLTRDEVIEQCAKAAEAEIVSLDDLSGEQWTFQLGINEAAASIAGAIRRLKSKPPGE